ncbi:5-carboxymethyl-2-hydroxymuconate Delta-isomerase [Acinetobacter equi]|uniref:5-carboxymethyl-2-hydroxymuconate isomerase n=1 Tax=Acinetobacter equi TaxID=1324350 RepID=A0A0N9W310_9GAMM|nr:5-carboxymethyl-2-hydroxymuconate Delta-isomerase [Acinetobacter equi]ALH95386.1 5-carboxymethyl-2-hydroxymuconate isomerase [Acinetobacter equi]
MPHIHVEYSDNIENFEAKPLLTALNQCLVVGEYATAVDIKSRAMCQKDYVIGINEQSQGYVHVKISLLTGRSLEIRQAISEKALGVLIEYLPKQSKVEIQACIEIIEMPKETYSKKIIQVY